MTGVEFTAALAEYYGAKYTPLERSVVGPWLTRFERDGGDYRELFDEVTEQVSKAFGKLPDKAQLASAVKAIKARGPAYDQNALPPPPPNLWRPLTPAEQAAVEAELRGVLRRVST